MVVISQAAALTSTRRWVETVVVGLALCPWASPVRNSIRYAYTDHPRQPLGRWSRSVGEYATTPTTILVHPHALTDFDEMNAFLAEADGYIEDSGRADAFQIVGFHPDFQFRGETKDASNWTIARRTR